MRTIQRRAQTFINLLLPGAISAALLVSLCPDAESAPKRATKRATKVQKARPKTTGKASGLLRLKRHAFPDVTMGIPAAYTVMLPPNWSAQGQVQWQPSGEASFPQKKFEITSPQRGRINFEPSMTFSYMEGPGLPTQGIPAPANFPQWLIQAVAQSDPKISNIKLIKSSRNAKAEAFMNQMNTGAGGGNGMQQEVYDIVVEYNEENLRRRDEMNVTYTRFSPYLSQNMNSQMWSIYPGGSISAPAAQFAAQRPMLLNVLNTVRSTPQWYIQSQAAIAEMSRRRTANNWEIIKERGRQIGKLSDADYNKYKKDMSGGVNSDAAQRTRINGIYETDDFRDTNGNIVNLPIHYNHVFSDGKGNYVLSNNSQDRPGGTWKPINPMK